MGANAQTSVPLFVANSVLTAAQQNISAATGVPVFATTVTRDAAFGGSNKVLAEGQLAYIEASNIVQYYDGAAWATVGPSTPGGLVPVVSTTTVTAAATITATPFSATYDNYLILMTMQTSTASAINLQLTIGGVAATSNYNYQLLEVSATSVSGARSTAQSSWFWSNAATTANAYAVQVINPFKVARTELVGQGSTGAATAIAQLNIVGNHSTATSYDGFKVFFDSTYTGTGTYTVYGYGKTA